jgi:hypothetical protein
MRTPIATRSEDLFAIRVEPRLAPAHVRRRGGRATRLPWLRFCSATAIVVALVAYAAHHSEVKNAAAVADPPQPFVATAPPPAWQPIGNPVAIYAIDAPALKALPLSLEARRHVSGAREDALAYGAVESAAEAHARFVVHDGDGPQDPHSFFVDLARSAADAGLAVTRSTQPAALPTKFGTAESAEVVLSATSDRSCHAFRLASPEAEFHVLGWACGAGGRPVTHRELTCLIDRLALTPAADDAELKALFVRAETQRHAGCSPAPAATARNAAAPGRAPKGAQKAKRVAKPKPARVAEPRATVQRILSALR